MKKIIFLFFLIFSCTLFSQKEANFWYFGLNAGLDFTNGDPVPIKNGFLNTFEGCSTISNRDGVLQFYSDGITIWDKSHDIMKYTNGDLANNLKGDPSSTQSALIVQNPIFKNLYYIFTVGASENKPGFFYYTIDMDKNNNKGEVIAGPIDLSFGSPKWSEKVTAVQGENCNELWIISLSDQTFFCYKLKESGIDFVDIVTSKIDYRPISERGYLKVSPDGTKIAIADYTQGLDGFENTVGEGKLVLFDFDVVTGKVSENGLELTNPIEDGSPYGIEFSHESKKLYVSTHDTSNNKLLQFNLKASNIKGSKAIISSKKGYRGALQIGPNYKIYASVPQSYRVGTKFLDVIENPDEDADKIIYNLGGVNLGNQQSTQGFPPFLQSIFAPAKIVDSETRLIDLTIQKKIVCIGDTFRFEPDVIGNASSTYIWTKEGDPSININTRIFTIDYSFGSGIYNLDMTAIDACGNEKKLKGSIEIEFLPKPEVIKIPVYKACDFDDNPLDGITSFNLTLQENALSNNTANVNVAFFETSDINFTNPIPDKENYINKVSTNSGNYKLIVKISYNNSECFQLGEIELKVNATSLNNYDNEYLSELDLNANKSNAEYSDGSNNSNFNFEAKTSEIIDLSSGAFSSNTHNIEFYENKSNAILQKDRIVNPYENYLFTNDTEIFVRISTKSNNSCEAVGSFKIFINDLPEPNKSNDLNSICVNNPKDNLNTIFLDLDGNTNNLNDRYQWFLNNKIINGATSAILSINSGGNYKVEAYRDYGNDISNPLDNTTTTGYSTFFVAESNKALISSIEVIDDQFILANNTLTVNVQGLGDYEYALNDQSNSSFKRGLKYLPFTFTNVPFGLNTLYVRDRNGCGTTIKKEISFLYFRRHFSPNGDGVFDTWNIDGPDFSFYQTIQINIFDRFGNLLKSIKENNQEGWDGSYNNQLMPTNDYWYKAVLIDLNGILREKKGHFSLIRK